MRQIMTAAPHCIDRTRPIHEARDLMKRYRLRHLPVLEGGKLVGIISERDVAEVERMIALDPDDETVEDGMSQDLYCTTVDSLAKDVVGEMAKRHYESAVIVDHDKVVGIFTTTDALDLLAEIL